MHTRMGQDITIPYFQLLSGLVSAVSRKKLDFTTCYCRPLFVEKSWLYGYLVCIPFCTVCHIKRNVATFMKCQTDWSCVCVRFDSWRSFSFEHILGWTSPSHSSTISLRLSAPRQIVVKLRCCRFALVGRCNLFRPGKWWNQLLRMRLPALLFNRRVHRYGGANPTLLQRFICFLGRTAVPVTTSQQLATVYS